jgi:hypothetical protein
MRLRELRPFQHVRWEPNDDELRRFAVSMVVGFGILGLVAAWRHHGYGPSTWALWGAGLGLAAGALVPGVGRAVYLGVYLPTSLVGFVVSHVLLLLIFSFLFTPLALLLRLLGKDLLALRVPGGRSLWTDRPPPREADSYYRQY